jgi:hypothetical protein
VKDHGPSGRACEQPRRQIRIEAVHERDGFRPNLPGPATDDPQPCGTRRRRTQSAPSPPLPKSAIPLMKLRAAQAIWCDHGHRRRLDQPTNVQLRMMRPDIFRSHEAPPRRTNCRWRSQPGDLRRTRTVSITCTYPHAQKCLNEGQLKNGLVSEGRRQQSPSGEFTPGAGSSSSVHSPDATSRRGERARAAAQRRRPVSNQRYRPARWRAGS